MLEEELSYHKSDYFNNLIFSLTLAINTFYSLIDLFGQHFQVI